MPDSSSWSCEMPGCTARPADHHLVLARSSRTDPAVAAYYTVITVHTMARANAVSSSLVFTSHPHAMQYVAEARDAGAQYEIPNSRARLVFDARHPLPAQSERVYVPSVDLHTECRRGRRCGARGHIVTITRQPTADSKIQIAVTHGRRRRAGGANTNVTVFARASDAYDAFRNHWAHLAGAMIHIPDDNLRRSMWEQLNEPAVHQSVYRAISHQQPDPAPAAPTARPVSRIAGRVTDSPGSDDPLENR